MKKIANYFIITGLLLTTITSCKKYLDVNNDPNNPSAVEAALLLPPILQNFSHGVQIDNRYIARFVQMWQYGAVSGDQWDQHGYVEGVNDRGAAMFRSVYWRGGLNLSNMIDEAIANEKWDYAGVGYALRAYGWQTITDIHGELPVTNAYTFGQTAFSYDTQENIYLYIRTLCDTALTYLNKTDGKVSAQSLGRGDQVYKGDRSKWIKFVYGLLARNYNHLSKKSNYKPDEVLNFISKSFESNVDDAFTPSEGVAAADASPYGQSRSAISGEESFHAFGQGKYAMVLMDSTIWTGAKLTDPRMALMLFPSPDGVYRGLTPGKGVTELPVVNQRVPSLYGLANNVAPALAQTGLKFIWRNDAPVPIMTFAELQFIKAEAAFNSKPQQLQVAWDAYKKGIDASMDFVGTVGTYSKTTFVPGTGTSAITPAQKLAYNTAIGTTALTPPASFNLSKILMQKWIALYGWGAHEIWVDMRRYNYDAAFYTGFTLPSPLYILNGGKVIQRIRPRYNSEYMWNRDALEPLGGLLPDYHTKPIWFALP